MNTIDKPSSPGKPTLNPNNLDPETVTIRWDPPLYDGGSKITGYLVEHKGTGSPHWVKASPIKVRQTQLTVCGLEPGWRYQFRVFAESEIGLSDPSPSSEPLAIFVHRSAAIAPYFITELKDLAVLENEKVEFNVNFEGVPSPKISWYKDGLEIFSSRCQKINTEGCVSRYIIYEASISDESEIKCTATNKVGYAVTKAYLKVEAPPTIRLPRQYEDGVIFEEGELIRLKVSVVGQPQPLVFWYLNGEQLNSSPRHDIEYADKTAVLKIKDAQRLDRGEYQIQAVNDLGDDEASILVTIANRPQPPTKLTVDKVEGNSVSLSWSQPEDDGGCRIGSYIIEYYKMGWNVWLKAATSRQLSIKLDDLIEASQYRFRVKAENPYGVSYPSTETGNIFIPDIKNNIFTLEDVPPKHRCAMEMLSFSNHNEFESQTSGTDCSNDHMNWKRSLAPEKPKRKKVKKLTHADSIVDAHALLEINKDQEANIHQKVDQRVFSTPSPQPSSINMDDGSRTSSELMLVLVHSNEDLTHHKTGSLDGVPLSTIYSNVSSIPPPVSLSAPELGSEMEFFKPLHRNCVSSTEILHESTVARFYKELQEEDAIYKLKQQFNSLSSKKVIENLAIDGPENTSNVMINMLKKYTSLPKSGQTVLTKDYMSDYNEDSNQRRNNPDISQKRQWETEIPHIKKLEDICVGRKIPDHIHKEENIHSIGSRFNWRKNLNKLPENVSTSPCPTSTDTFSSRGGYSPISGTFHYPDLFVESLTKSPKFKSIPSSPPNVGTELGSRKLIQVEFNQADQYSSLQSPPNEIPTVSLIKAPDQNNLTIDAYHNSDPSSSSCGNIFNSESVEFSSDNEFNVSGKSDTDEKSMSDEDETSSNDEDFDPEFEADTYHPVDKSPLSFEQALAISNPKRSISPTSDLFLETELPYKDINEMTDGLHYFNRNFEDIDHLYLADKQHNMDIIKENRDIDQKLKPILKYSGYNDFDNPLSSSTLSPSSLNFHNQHFANYGSKKKQVRIEEPSNINKNWSTPAPTLDDGDSSTVIINHYSDIVRQYGNTPKPSARMYLTYDELKAAAQFNDEDNARDKIVMTNEAYKNICNPFEEQINKIITPVETARQDLNVSLQEAKIRYRVHFFFDFFLDIVMFIFACWLFCFKDERLAIPIIILMVYRQLYNKLKYKLANFKFWNRKQSVQN